MEREKIVDIANDFLINEFEVEGDEISDDAHFKKTLGLDSLDYIDLVVVIESKFGVKLGETDFKNIVTFDDFYSTIENKINSKM
ncbi:acyl carrier protein [Chryseobacterium echinoideorum]|uniref:acyl carrier protein n=1 Tax=Chryseobacterium echinoideorum TaxID=1549648 RepID=UPI001184E8F4|nr:phosphopantetheine-binding protein [Chryseobacterium echinoideorum]